ncbi:MAG: chromate efflux transporter [Bacteroidetes bacterium]|nr:chromate efflux transporter [Bacteroidota bacterium]
MKLSELFWVFLRIGSISFGGFMALVSVVEKELTQKRKVLSSETILDGISLASVLPGPVAVNMVAFAGYELRGIRGAIISVVAVILPSFILIYSLSVAYFSYGHVPAIAKIFEGFIPAVMAIIASVVYDLSIKHIKHPFQVFLCLCSALLIYLVGGLFLTILIFLISGLAGKLFLDTPSSVSADEKTIIWDKKKLLNVLGLSVAILMGYVLIELLIPEAGIYLIYKQILFLFSGLSLTLFGGGYVFIPIIQQLVVVKMNWLTVKEFTDGIALGQVTPGPILISAAFIGYKVAGLTGAVLGTIGMFMPSVLLTILGAQGYRHIRQSTFVKAMYTGIRPAVIGMIISAIAVIGKTATWNWLCVLIMASSFIAIVAFRINIIWVILASGLTWYFLN